MDISGVANLAARMSQQRTAEAADVLVLKKALQSQEQAAMTLIAAVTPSAGLAAHLGRNINVVA